MDKPRAQPLPGPDSDELRGRREEALGLWSQYRGFLADAEGELQRMMQEIDQNVRRGTVAPEQAQQAELQARQAYESRLAEIESGPTRTLLNTEYEAQRDAAMREHEQRYASVLGQTYEHRESPAVGEPGYYRVYQSGRGEDMEEFVGPTDPRAAVPQFSFAPSADDYWSSLAGPEEERPASGGPSQPSAAARVRSAATGSSAASAVGVGRVYSWY